MFFVLVYVGLRRFSKVSKKRNLGNFENSGNNPEMTRTHKQLTIEYENDISTMFVRIPTTV